MAVDLGSAQGSLDLDISGFLNELKTAQTSAKTAMDKIEGTAQGLGSQFKSAGRDAGTNLTAGIKSGVSGAEAAVKSVASSADGLGSQFKSAGSQAGGGFATALKSGLSKAESAFEAVVSAAKDAASKIKAQGDEAGSGFASGLGSKIGGAATVLAGGTAAVGAALAGLVANANEVQEDMGKLETAFTTVGLGAETASSTYNDFVGVMGEIDTAVEASNHLAKLTTNTEELATWGDIAAGVYATFGDSLPLEGLTEAANETARVGQVTGPLADALNWAGVSEDEFNQKLAACNSEQERATLITNTLNGLYEEAAQKYKDINGPLITFRQSLSDAQIAMSDMGTALMPVASGLLSAVVPALQQLSSVFQQFVPQIMNSLNAGNFSVAGQQIANAIMNIATSALQQLPSFINAGVQLVGGLITGIVQQLPHLITTFATSFSALIPQLATTISEALNAIVNALPAVFQSIATALPTMLPTLIQGVTTLIQGIATALPTLVQSIVTALPQLIQGIVNGLMTGLPTLIQGFVQLFNAVVQSLPIIISGLLAAMPQLISLLVTALTTGLPLLVQGFVQLFNAFAQAIPQIISAITPYIPTLINAIVQAIIALVPVILDAGVQLFTGLLNAIIQVAPQIISAVAEMLGQVISSVASWVGEMASNGLQAGQQFLSGVADQLGQLPGRAAEFLGNVISNAASFVGEMAGKATEAGSQFLNNIVSELSQVPSRAASIGSEIVNGIWNGIQSAAGWLSSQISSWAGSLLDGAKSALGIHSPSKEFADEVGYWIPAGVGEGIENGSHLAVDAVNDLSKQVVEAAKPVSTALSEAVTLNADPVVKFEEQVWESYDNIVGYGEVATESVIGYLDEMASAFEGESESLTDSDRNWGSWVRNLHNNLSGAQKELSDLKRLFNRAGDSFNKYFVDEIVSGSAEYDQLVEKMGDLTDEQLSEIIGSYEELAIVELEHEVAMKELRVEYSNQEKSVKSVREKLLDFKSVVLDLKEAVYSNDSLDTAFKQTGITLEDFAADAMQFGLDISDATSLIENFTSTVSDGFNAMSRDSQVGLDEFMGNLSNNIGEAIKWKNDVATVFSHVSDSMPGAKEFKEAILEGGYNVYGQLISDLAEQGGEAIYNAIKVYKYAIDQGATAGTSVIDSIIGTTDTERFKTIGVEVSDKISAGIIENQQPIAEAMNVVYETAKTSIASIDVASNEVGAAMPLSIADGVEENVPRAMSAIQTSIDDGVSKLDVNPMADALSGSVKQFASTIQSIYNEVAVWFGNVEQFMSASVQGMADTLANVVDRVYSAIAAANDAMQSLRELQFETKAASAGSYADTSFSANAANGGGDTYIFNSPKAIDEVQAAKQMKKAKQELAEGF